MPHQNPCQQKAPTGTAPLPLDETGRVDLERLQLPRGISITRLSRAAPKETFYCSCGQGFDERPLLQTHQQKCPTIKEMCTVIKFRKFSPKITKICPIGLQEFNALGSNESNDEANNISGPDLCDDDLMADTDVDIDLYDDMKSELLSENNESNDVANNWTTVRSSKRSSLIAKITPDDVGMDTSEESGLKSSTPDKLGNNLSFHCKDLVLGELICDYCSYTNFSKRRMINHLKKKHQWTEPTFVKVAEEDIIEAPIIEIPSAISPIHEKHVTFAEEDTIITDFSLDTTPTSSTFKTVTKKKPFIYDGSDILNKLFSMEP